MASDHLRPGRSDVAAHQLLERSIATTRKCDSYINELALVIARLRADIAMRSHGTADIVHRRYVAERR